MMVLLILRSAARLLHHVRPSTCVIWLARYPLARVAVETRCFHGSCCTLDQKVQASNFNAGLRRTVGSDGYCMAFITNCCTRNVLIAFLC